MKKGIIQSYDQGSGTGTISRCESGDVGFNSDRIMGRDRKGLKQGDSVCFKIENVFNNHVAINIRKCM